MAASPDLSRRALLRGRIHAPPPLRPPWALAEPAFLAACTACDRCIQACPEQVLVRAGGGLPVFEPARGECTFCGDCADACAPRALQRGASAPWGHVAVLGEACLTGQGVVCLSCAEACPERAIRMQRRGPVAVPVIDPATCSGCGACVGVCPTAAVSLRADAGVPSTGVPA